MSVLLDGIKKNAGMAMLIGTLLILLGLAAMGSPFMAGLSVVLMLGTLLVLAGVFQLILAVRAGAGFLAVVVALLTGAAGAYMFMNPALALATLTIFLAAFLIASGLFEAIDAFNSRPGDGWGWVMTSGIFSVILGLLIWLEFPESSVLVIGILLGFRLLFSGLTLLMVGMAARTAVKKIQNTQRS